MIIAIHLYRATRNCTRFTAAAAVSDHQKPTRGHTLCAREILKNESVLVRGRALFGELENTLNRLLNPARNEFLGAFKALRRLFLLGNARFQACQQSSCCVADTFHALSFPNAPELHEQLGRRRMECPTKVLKDLTK